ncbi:tyrosine-protein phosphatase [bacterium]|nr:tyrosine-protein phosphatase [bacterium]
MLKTLVCALVLVWTAWAEPARLQEEQDNLRWTQEIRRYAEGQPDPVRQALEQVITDGQAMGRLSPHKQHDTLQATLSKIDRARLEPEGAIQRERLDSPVSNFGEVVTGKLYRGAQPSPQALRWLHEQGVGMIVLLREPGVEETNYPDWSRQDYIRDARALGMQVVELVIRDHTVPTPAQIHRFLETVQQSQVPVYFHCSAGVGRTGIMAGLYERSTGVEAADALAHAKRFQLNPALVPDHALQASLLVNYPLPGHTEVFDLPWGIGGLNPVKAALAAGTGFSLPPTARLHLDLSDPEPGLRRMAQVLRGQELICLEFRTREEVDLLASLARVIPVAQKMGCLKLGDDLSLDDLDRARRLLGPVPFEVVVTGPLTPALLAQLEGHCEIVDLGTNPSEAQLTEMSKHGLYAHLRSDPRMPLAHYQALGFGFLSD